MAVVGTSSRRLPALLGAVVYSASANLPILDHRLLVSLGNGSFKSVRVRKGQDLEELLRRFACGQSEEASWCLRLRRSLADAPQGLLSKLLQRGLKHQAEQQDAAAAALFERAAGLAPQLALPHVALGALQLARGELAPAERSLRRGLRLDAAAAWDWLARHSRSWGVLAPLRLGARPAGVLHVGAHEAREALLYALQGLEQVLWVEANPRLAGALRRNVGRFGHAVRQALCWNASGELRRFHLASRARSRESLTWSSVFPLGSVPSAMGVVDEGTLELPTTSGADILAGYAAAYGERLQQWGPLDFLVLDVHGAEYECLQGFGAHGLRGFKYVLVELSGPEMFLGQRRACAVHGLLSKHGFACEVNCGRCEDAAHYDAFYVRRGLQLAPLQADVPSLTQRMLSLS